MTTTSKITGHVEGDVYIIEFSQPIGNTQNPKGTAKYYVGWCKAGEAERRLNEHRTGKGASITRAVAERGIQMNLVVVIEGVTRATERTIKNRGNTPKLVARMRKNGQTLY